jgi:hypothetical protein
MQRRGTNREGSRVDCGAGSGFREAVRLTPFSIALAYAGLGDQETAIDWLEKARAERSDAMAILKVHPLLLHLHANPRFAQLAREVGYAQ